MLLVILFKVLILECSYHHTARHRCKGTQSATSAGEEYLVHLKAVQLVDDLCKGITCRLLSDEAAWGLVETASNMLLLANSLLNTGVPAIYALYHVSKATLMFAVRTISSATIIDTLPARARAHIRTEGGHSTSLG